MLTLGRFQSTNDRLGGSAVHRHAATIIVKTKIAVAITQQAQLGSSRFIRTFDRLHHRQDTRLDRRCEPGLFSGDQPRAPGQQVKGGSG